MAEHVHRFDAGRISLDLMATLGNRRGERLPDPAALEAWLLAGAPVERLRGVDADDLRLTRALRAALFGVVDAELQGHVPPAADVETINAAAAVTTPAARLRFDADGPRGEPAVRSVAEILGAIARDAIDLLTGPDRSLLRECAAADCSGIYVDSSRGRNRRWCSTARCGNRARVAGHRARRQAALEAHSGE